jgi:hypothetical protein
VIVDSEGLVCFCSLAYFNSEECGREWRLLTVRCDAWVEAKRKVGLGPPT